VVSKQGAPLIIRVSDQAHCFATWDRVLINMWLGEMTLPAAHELLGVARQFIADNAGQALSCLSIVGSHSPPPTDKVRVELSRAYSELAAAAVQQVWVAEGSQSRAALVRAVALSVSTAAASLLRFEFAVSVYEAAEMIAPLLSNGSGRAPVLGSIVDQVRSHMGEVAPSARG
jgi:hypothetical protein